MTTLDSRELRNAFGSFMTGVTVVTTMTQDGNPLGFTANSFTSVSISPALLLISIAKSSSNYAHFSTCQNFAINILSDNQKNVSNTFAKPSIDRFAEVEWSPSELNNPILHHVSAWFDCVTHQVIDAGDHTILIGKISNFSSSGSAGLGYYRGGYFDLVNFPKELISGASTLITTLITHENKVLLIQDDKGLWTLPHQQLGKLGAEKVLSSLFNQYQPEASANFIYSVYDDNNHQYISFLCNSPSESPLQGKYFDIELIDTLELEDQALKSMLCRYRKEYALQAYGIYYGNHNEGTVKTIN